MGGASASDREWSADNLERSKTYLRAYCLLIRAAESRSTVYYRDIADLMGLSHVGNYMGLMTGKLLGEIVEREHSFGRPMLSAVAVSSTTELPGSGFYGLAELLGLIPEGASTQEQRAFWERERDRVYEEWSQ
jgi:hypothetical protein